MLYSPHIWDQIKNITADILIKALERDGWTRDESRGAILVYKHPDGRRITVKLLSETTASERSLTVICSLLAKESEF